MPTKRPAKPAENKSGESQSASLVSPLDAVIARFELDAVEAQVLRILGDAELSLDAWQRLRDRGGPSARSLGLDTAAVIERLRVDGKLRRHALVHVDAPDRLAGASDALRLEVGLLPRQRHLPNELVRYVAGPRVPSELAKRLDGSVPQVVLLDATPTQLSAQTLADGLQRVVMAGSIRGLPRDSIARLRRDADLERAVLWVAADDASLSSLLVEPVGNALVVLAEVAHVEARAPWRVRREKMGVEPGVAPAAPRNELDYVRMLAQRDADAALGIVRAAPVARQTVAGKIVDASVRIAETQPAELVKVEPAKPEPVSVEPVTTVPVEPPPVEVAAVPPVEAEPNVDGPRIDVAADASPDVRARAATQSPSAKQRIELMEGLASVKGAVVIAALRHNAKSEHAGVRGVAERIMGQMFGSNWNRTRAVAPPVQPLRGPDDKP